jgi:4'-phosphopantetheinyl transferase
MRADCRSFELSENEVHIWTFDIRALATATEKFRLVLASDEMDRAAQFRFNHLRESFVRTRSTLRHLLGRYMDIHPAGIQFTYGPNGKPALASAENIQFNMTHSGDMAAIAITTDCPIGVDVEQIRPVENMLRIAEQFFCPEETAEIISLPADDRECAFFCYWTRKEAYAKAIGAGLGAPLNTIRVTAQSGSSSCSIFTENEVGAAQTWTLHDLQLAANYAAAVGYRGRERSLSVFPIADASAFLVAS